jgi:hypothetical protein
LIFVHRPSDTPSHDRPYSASGVPSLADRDIGFVQWVERHGYDLAYATSEDLHAGRVDPGRYRALVFCGHDEYWSVPMRGTAATARNTGTSLVFLGANNCYWRIRYQASPAGAGERVIRCAKDAARRRLARPALTTRWRQAGSPEQQLIGAQYISTLAGHAPLVVRDADHWLWAGTQLRDGDTIPGVVWREADREMPDAPLPPYRERAVLAASPFTRRGTRHLQHTSLYQAPSGAWVFAAGTLGWTAALLPDGVTDPRIAQATRNLLDRVLTPPSAAQR